MFLGIVPESVRMRTKKKKGGRTQDIRNLLVWYKQSGLRVREFCAREKVSAGSLYKWLRREKPPSAGPTLMEVSEAKLAACEGFGVHTPEGYPY